MTASMRQRDRPATLAVKALHAEAQVLSNRRRARVHAALLGQKLRTELTSPSALLLAAGLGFVTEGLTRRRSSVPDSTDPPAITGSGPFAKALKLVAFLASLMKAFPGVEMGPSAHRAYPVGVPASQSGPAEEP